MGRAIAPFAEVVLEVPFHDVDMMQVAWHGHYYKYFEAARTKLYRDHHCDVAQIRRLGYLLPVIESRCRYIAPVRYGMTVKVRATMAETEYRLKVNYLLRDAATGARLARGSTVQVAVHREDYQLCMTTPKDIVALFR